MQERERTRERERVRIGLKQNEKENAVERARESPINRKREGK